MTIPTDPDQLERLGIANGCGGKGGAVGRFFNRFIPNSQGMRQVCDEHDRAYAIGGTEVDRKRADQGLLHGIMDLRSHKWMHVWFVVCGHGFYWAVRWQGYRFFTYREAGKT